MKRKYKTHDWEKLHKKIVVSLKSKCLDEVANELEINYHTLLDYCRRKKIKRHVKKERYRVVSGSQSAAIIAFDKSGMSSAEIAKKLHLPLRAVNRELQYRYLPHFIKEPEGGIINVADFMRNVGDTLDSVQEQGIVTLRSMRRGDMVILSASYFEELKQNDKK